MKNIKDFVKAEIIEGVQVDQNELESMAKILQEANQDHFKPKHS